MNIEPIYLPPLDACIFVGLSESTMQQLVRDGGGFPKPRQLSKRRTGYLVRELKEWAEARPVSDLPPPANTGAKKGVAA